jgi:hypothetical protein
VTRSLAHFPPWCSALCHPEFRGGDRGSAARLPMDRWSGSLLCKAKSILGNGPTALWFQIAR